MDAQEAGGGAAAPKDDLLRVHANELCIAVETLQIGYPAIFASCAGKILLQRKSEVVDILRKSE